MDISEPGDFSLIIPDPLWCYILTHDYRAVFKHQRYINFLLSKCYFIDCPEDIWDTPPGDETMLFMQILCKCHTRETFKKSLRILTYIALNGWECYFLLNYKEPKKKLSKRAWCCGL